MTRKYIVTMGLFVATLLLITASFSQAGPVSYWDSNVDQSVIIEETSPKTGNINLTLAPGDPVDFDAALAAGADYLRRMQADITEDNAGNGTDGVDESPDDPDDGGWDWVTTTFSHTTGASPTNLYGVTAMGAYYAYLESGDAALFTVMQDAADQIVSGGVPDYRTGGDMKFLLMFNALYSAEVAPTTVYADAAKAKYDGRITVYGSATLLAEYIRDVRGVTQGYANGIIGWDIGIYSVVAQRLFDIYGGSYALQADAIAEVLWQDSYNSNPGLFDIVADAGFDPTWTDKNFWWYTLGLTGLIDAFSASGNHTAEVPGLVTLLLESQYSGGGISGSYGANPDDEDWQSTGYAMMTLGTLDQATYQGELNAMGYWIGATQDVSGGWVYGSGNHYPEVGGECTAGLYYTSNINSDVLVDASFTSQADVDVYNAANSTSYIWGFNAFSDIQAGIDAVNGSTVTVAAGTYVLPAQLVIDKDLTLVGAGVGVTILQPGFNTSVGYYLVSDALIYVDYGVIATIEELTIDGTGFTVRHGIQSRGANLDVKNCDIRDIYADTYAGRGIVFLTGTGLVDNCTMSNIQRIGVHIRGAIEPTAPDVDVVGLVYVGKGIGDFLDYGIEFGGGGTGTAQNCTITACRGVATVDGSGSAGILATDYYGTGTAATITDCDISDNSIGIYAGYTAGDATVVVAYHNDIVGNDLGIFSVTAAPVNAEENWWGSASGAVVDAMNDGPIDFTPWCTDATHTSCTLTSGLSLMPAAKLEKCGDLDTVWIPIEAGVTGVEAASFLIGYDENYMTAVSVLEGPEFSGMSLYSNLATPGEVQIDIGVLAGDFSGPGTLVGVVFAPTVDVASIDITFLTSILRDAGNQDIYHTTTDATREIDCTLPDAPTDFAVSPGHEKVKLSWVNPTGDPSFVGVEVRRNPWAVGAYPEYDDFAAAVGYPVTALDGDLVYSGAAENFVDTNNTTAMPRNAYYYSVLAFDNAGNYSVVTSAQNGRATNYWLGDVTGDGEVYYGDLTLFSNTYYEIEGSGNYNAEFDIGPTYSSSPLGIPMTDNAVEFEDLSIFSINFNVVGPNLKAVPLFENTEVVGPLALALESQAVAVATGDEFVVNVALQNNKGDLKAAWYTLTFDPTDLELISQRASSAIGQSDQPLFYDGRIRNGKIDVSLALLGGQQTISGSGNLTELRFRMLGDGSSLRFGEVDLRDAENQSLEVIKNGLSFAALSVIPSDFSLAQNYPNPFNPSTSIQFALPTASHVTLEVFNVVGQRVVSLVDTHVEAGEHTVVWNAVSQASGVYFYKLTADGFVETKKMLLMK